MALLPALLALPGGRTVVYMRGRDCTTTGILCTCPASFPLCRETGLDGGGGTGWMMCKNCAPLTPEGGAGTAGGAEVITEGGGEEEEEDGEWAGPAGEGAEGGVVRALLIDRSTGSVCVWNSRASAWGGSGLTLLRSGGGSMPG